MKRESVVLQRGVTVYNCLKSL
jgi:hypothetical protein